MNTFRIETSRQYIGTTVIICSGFGLAHSHCAQRDQSIDRPFIQISNHKMITMYLKNRFHWVKQNKPNQKEGKQNIRKYTINYIRNDHKLARFRIVTFTNNGLNWFQSHEMVMYACGQCITRYYSTYIVQYRRRIHTQSVFAGNYRSQTDRSNFNPKSIQPNQIQSGVK